MCWSFQFLNPESRATSSSRGCINSFAYCMKHLVHSDKLATRYLRRLKTHSKVASNMWLLLEKLHFLPSYNSSMNFMTTFLDESSRLGLSVHVLRLVHLRHGFGSRTEVIVPKRINASLASECRQSTSGWFGILSHLEVSQLHAVVSCLRAVYPYNWWEELKIKSIRT